MYTKNLFFILFLNTCLLEYIYKFDYATAHNYYNIISMTSTFVYRWFVYLIFATSILICHKSRQCNKRFIFYLIENQITDVV